MGLIEERIGAEEFDKLNEVLDFLPSHLIDSSFKDKCIQLVDAVLNHHRNENITYMNTRSPENFLTYFDVPIKKASYTDFPENCVHARIAYFTWMRQGNAGRDPTAMGRKIKKMAIMVG